MAGDWIKIECVTPSKPEIDVIPSMATPDGDKAALSVRRVINVAAEDIREIVNQMFR